MDRNRINQVDQKLENGGQQRRRRPPGGRRHPKKPETSGNPSNLESKLSNLKLETGPSKPRNEGYRAPRSKPEQRYHEQSRVCRTESVSSGYSSASTRSSGGKSSSNSNLAAKNMQSLRQWKEGPKGLDNPNNFNKIERPLDNESTSEDEGWEPPPPNIPSDKSRHWLTMRELAKRDRAKLMPRIEKIPEDRFAIGDDNWMPRPKFEKNEVFETEEELIMYEDQLKVALHYHEFRDYYPSSTVPLQDSAPSTVPVDATVLLDSYTHHDACRFQAMCTVWKLRPRLQDLYIPEDPAHAIPTVSTVSPGITVAWYKVIAVEETSYLARACHLNLAGSLSSVAILRSSRFTDYGSSILGGLVLGDLLVVHELRRTGFGREDREAETTSQCYWQIAKFQVFRREIQIFENSILVGDPESPQKFLVDIETGRIFENPKNQESEKLRSVEIITPPEIGNPKMCTGAKLDPLEIQKIENQRLAPPTFKPTLRIVKETKITAGFLKSWSKNFERTIMAAHCALRASKPFKILDFKNLEIRIPWTPQKWTPGSKISLSNGQIAKIESIAYLGTKEIKITIETPPTPSSSAPKYVFNIDRILHRGFFENLPKNSNGKQIIEAMYGNHVIEGVSQAPPTFNDPYIGQVLHGCPLTISHRKDSVISAAVEIAQQTEQRQILLIGAEQSVKEQRVFEMHGIRTAKFLDCGEQLSNVQMSNPQIVICSMDTVGHLLQYPAATIQILSGAEILEADFTWLVVNFPRANFGVFAGSSKFKISNSKLTPIFENLTVGNFVGRAKAEMFCPVF